MELQLITSRFTSPFGIPRYNESLLRELSRAGIEFSVWETRPAPLLERLHPLLKRLHIDALTFSRSYPLRLPGGPAGLKHLTNHTLAAALLLDGRGPSIVTVHDIDSDWEVFRRIYTAPRYAIYRLFHRLSLRGLRKAAWVITDTRCMKSRLIAELHIPADIIFVVPLGVDREVFTPHPHPSPLLARLGLPAAARFILHVGTDAPRKNLPNLVRAFAQLHAHHPDVKLVKVGRPAWPGQQARIRSLLQDLGIEEHVIFLGPLSDRDLAAIYSLAHVCVFPSLYEGFGLPVLEAMSCGTPVVTSDTSCLPEVAGGAALLVDPRDVDAIAAAVCRLIEDPDLARDLRQKGIARAARFTWERTARETVQVYYRAFSCDFLALRKTQV